MTLLSRCLYLFVCIILLQVTKSTPIMQFGTMCSVKDQKGVENTARKDFLFGLRASLNQANLESKWLHEEKGNYNFSLVESKENVAENKLELLSENTVAFVGLCSNGGTLKTFSKKHKIPAIGNLLSFPFFLIFSLFLPFSPFFPFFFFLAILS